MTLTMMMVALPPTVTSVGEAPASNNPDIVVRAVRGRCEIVYAGSTLDGRGQRKLAGGWPAGKPLRVLEPRGADRRCLVKITLSLAELGFNDLVFVDAPTPP
ncbi:hypothetical protein [Sphingomonas abietis]|uniref:Uncharacterized protein n=1 Tax=Sphingomonas abietis TaxID=3012344 RepID=A0ABY7NH42_9SPHN|nr:hypothetical protein [Sphingomonas abietis]WBO20862.1 hypothetical protein PBT88_11625 [Sphingomonas abietis]